MPVVQRIPAQHLGFCVGVDEVPAVISNRYVAAYRLFDGQILAKAAAEARQYPLGQQPTPIMAIVDQNGVLSEVREGDWLVLQGDPQTTFSLEVVSGEAFTENWRIVPAGGY